MNESRKDEARHYPGVRRLLEPGNWLNREGVA